MIEINEILLLFVNYVKKLDIRQFFLLVREVLKGLDFDDVLDVGSEVGDELECDYFNFGFILK